MSRGKSIETESRLIVAQGSMVVKLGKRERVIDKRYGVSF